MQHNRIAPRSDDAEFLSLRSVEKDAKVRVADFPLEIDEWPGRLSLLAVTNKSGYLVAARNDSFLVAPTRVVLEALKTSSSAFPQYLNLLKSKPVSVKFTCDGERFVICTRDGHVQVYATPTSSPPTNGATPPTIPLLHEFAHSSTPIRDVHPNPSDKPETMAILRGQRQSSSEVEILNVRTFQVVGSIRADAGTPFQTAICWSPKGKQIAVGNASGQVVHYGADGAQKFVITQVEDGQPQQEVASILWIENTVSLLVYRHAEDEHLYSSYVVTHDTKSNTATDYQLEELPPFGNTSRESARFYIHLRSWYPLKHLVLVGDAPADDISVVACTDNPQPTWSKLDLEETSRATLPLGEDGSPTTLVGFDVDVTSTTPISTSSQYGDDSPPLPPSPIMFIYTNDGSIVAYHILNSQTPSYPSMAPLDPNANSQATPTPAPAEIPRRPAGVTQSPFGATNSTPSFGSTAFGQSSPFGQAPTTPTATPAKPVTTFNQSTFGATTSPLAATPTKGVSAFGQSAFGASATPASTPLRPAVGFGQSAFGASATPAFGQPAAGASTTPAFGQSAFGASTTPAFGQSSFASAPSSIKAPSTLAPAAPAFGKSGFGAFAASPASFGAPAAGSGFGAVASTGASGFGFGATLSSAVGGSTTQPTSTFGSTSFGGSSFATASQPKSSAILPGTGAFGNWAPPPPAAPPSSTSQDSTTPVSTPKKEDAGSSSAGTKPVFGSTGFGAPAVIKKPAALQPVAVSSGSGFGSFAGASSSSTVGGFAGFAAPSGSSGSFADLLQAGKGGVSSSSGDTKSAVPSLAPKPAGTSIGVSATKSNTSKDEQEKEKGTTGGSADARAPQKGPQAATPPASAFSTMSFSTSLAESLPTPSASRKSGSSSGPPASATTSAFSASAMSTGVTRTKEIPEESDGEEENDQSPDSDEQKRLPIPGRAEESEATPPASAFSAMSFGTVLPGPSPTPPAVRQSAFSVQPPSSTTTSGFSSISTSTGPSSLNKTVSDPSHDGEDAGGSTDADGTVDGSEVDGDEDEVGPADSAGESSELEGAAVEESDHSQDEGLEGSGERSGEEDQESFSALSPVPEADELEGEEEPTNLNGSSYFLPQRSSQGARGRASGSAASANQTALPPSPQDDTTTPRGSPAKPLQTGELPQNQDPSSKTPRASPPAQGLPGLGSSPSLSGSNRSGGFAFGGRGVFSTTPSRSSPLSTPPIKAESPPNAPTAVKAGPSSKLQEEGKPAGSIPMTMPLPGEDEEQKHRPRSKTPPLAFMGFGSSSKTQNSKSATFPGTTTAPASDKPLFGIPSFPFGATSVSPAAATPSVGVPSPSGDRRPTDSWSRSQSQIAGNVSGKGSLSSPQHPDATVLTPKLAGMEAEYAKIIVLTDIQIKKLSAVMTDVINQQRASVKPLISQTQVPTRQLKDSLRTPISDWRSLRPAILTLDEGVKQLERLGQEMKRSIVDLKVSSEKAEVRLADIRRYEQAQDDPQVADLKSNRQLAPEFEEKRARLEKMSETVSQRVHQLEVFVEDKKKRLDQLKSGKHSIEMPTLEAVARALNRMQKAAQLKLQDIEALGQRVQSLKLDDLDLFSDEFNVSSSGVGLSKLDASSGVRRPVESAATRVEAAVALNSERSAKRLRDSLMEARPNAPRLNRSANQKSRNPKHIHSRTRMPSTSHLKLTLTLNPDKSLPSWAKPSHPSSTTAAQGSISTSSLVRKTSDSFSKPFGAGVGNEVSSLGFDAGSRGKANVAPKLDLPGSGRRPTAPSQHEVTPRVGPIPRQNTRRGFGLHLADVEW